MTLPGFIPGRVFSSSRRWAYFQVGLLAVSADEVGRAEGSLDVEFQNGQGVRGQSLVIEKGKDSVPIAKDFS